MEIKINQEIKLPKWIRFKSYTNETVFFHLKKCEDVIFVNGLCQDEGKVIICYAEPIIKVEETVQDLVVNSDLIEVTGYQDSIEFVVNDIAYPEISLIGCGYSLDIYLDDDMKITKISTPNVDDGYTKQWSEVD